MFDATIENIESNRIVRYRLERDRLALSYADVLELWQTDAAFRMYFIKLLSDSPFAAYRWETPMLNGSSSNQPFQFVLLNAPEFVARQVDEKTYDKYFTKGDSDPGIVAIANLGGDATLVIPSPRTELTAYGHLAAFLRNAPAAQKDALWQFVGKLVKSKLGETPLWLSTAGGGVAWLHVRLDSRPKYYGYSPYKSAPPV